MLEDSKKPIKDFDDPEYCLDVHSHHLLPQLFKIFWEHVAPRGSFVDLVFRLVIFHQSLQGVPKF